MEDILANIPGIDSSKEVPVTEVPAKTNLFRAILFTNWLVLIFTALLLWGKR